MGSSEQLEVRVNSSFTIQPVLSKELLPSPKVAPEIKSIQNEKVGASQSENSFMSLPKQQDLGQNSESNYKPKPISLPENPVEVKDSLNEESIGVFEAKEEKPAGEIKQEEGDKVLSLSAIKRASFAQSKGKQTLGPKPLSKFRMFDDVIKQEKQQKSNFVMAVSEEHKKENVDSMPKLPYMSNIEATNQDKNSDSDSMDDEEPKSRIVKKSSKENSS